MPPKAAPKKTGEKGKKGPNPYQLFMKEESHLISRSNNRCMCDLASDDYRASCESDAKRIFDSI